MDWSGIGKKLTTFVGKYRYVLLIAVVGIFLMLLPSGNKEQQPQPTAPEATIAQEQSVAEQLKNILSQIHGAGKVQVMLTVSSGATTVYQYDTDSSGGQTGSVSHETVIVTDGNRNQSGLVQQINPPVYQGAIIVCQGADNDVVRLHIIEAVARVTGLGTDKISVLEMK